MPITKPGEGYRGTEGCIGYLLRQASHATHQKINRLLDQYRLTYPQFTVLNMINLEPGLHAADVARLCLLSPQAVNTIVTNLEKAELIERRAHDIHGRVLQLFLTKAGTKTLTECTQLVNDKVITQILAPLNAKDEQLIRQWLFQCTLN